MLNKLLSLNVNPNLILWIHNYLRHRPQYVKFQSVMSKCIVTNTGAPQGCVLSPLQFSLYTNDCNSNLPNCQLFKYADDTAILGRLSKEQAGLAEYKACIRDFIDWCQTNFLELNVSKTKELVFDFRRSQYVPEHTVINGENVEIVEEYKYMGTVIDKKLNWSSNIKRLYNKSQQRLYFLRKLHDFKVDHTIMKLFYRSVVQSVFTFCLSVFYGNANQKDLNKLSRIIRQSQRLTGGSCLVLDDLYCSICSANAKRIMCDTSHPLNEFYVYLRSGVRLKALKYRTSRFNMSFVPRSISKVISKCNR